MQFTIPKSVPVTVLVRPARRLNDDEYFRFCQANPESRFERSPEGEITIVPPAGYESDYRNGEVFAQLREWARRDGRGRASGPTTEFILPTGAAFSPDAAWLSHEQRKKLPKQLLKKFLPVCLEFVIEVMSPTDRLKTAQQKMIDWLEGGVKLGWLIDGDHETVYIYRTGASRPEKRVGIRRLAGEGPVAGFEMDLTEIWRGA